MHHAIPLPRPLRHAVNLHGVKMCPPSAMLMLNHLLERLNLGFHGLASRRAGKNARAVVLVV
jgi:hypothetical protein